LSAFRQVVQRVAQKVQIPLPDRFAEHLSNRFAQAGVITISTPLMPRSFNVRQNSFQLLSDSRLANSSASTFHRASQSTPIAIITLARDHPILPHLLVASIS
jgi:hypothetical protein